MYTLHFEILLLISLYFALISLISPSTGATLSANALLTAGFVEVSYALYQ